MIARSWLLANTGASKAINLKRRLCKRCGNCCIIHWKSFEATPDDVIRWRREGRADILKHLAVTSEDPNNQPRTFTPDSCPFLRRDVRRDIYWCTINDTKPYYCRNYPEDEVCEYMPSLS